MRIKNKKNKFNLDKIVDTKFSASINGYDPYEVDTFLDKVLVEVELMQDHINELENKNHELNEKSKELEKEILTLKTEINGYK